LCFHASDNCCSFRRSRKLDTVAIPGRPDPEMDGSTIRPNFIRASVNPERDPRRLMRASALRDVYFKFVYWIVDHHRCFDPGCGRERSANFVLHRCCTE
jgi:hypothetical protein